MNADKTQSWCFKTANYTLNQRKQHLTRLTNFCKVTNASYLVEEDSKSFKQTVKQLLTRVIYDLKATLVESWPPLTQDNAITDANIRNLLLSY